VIQCRDIVTTRDSEKFLDSQRAHIHAMNSYDDEVLCEFIYVHAIYSHESPFPAQQSKSIVDSQVQPGVEPHLVGSVMEQQLEVHFLDSKGLKRRLAPG
jgi:hypothetical protein